MNRWRATIRIRRSIWLDAAGDKAPGFVDGEGLSLHSDLSLGQGVGIVIDHLTGYRVGFQVHVQG